MPICPGELLNRNDTRGRWWPKSKIGLLGKELGVSWSQHPHGQQQGQKETTSAVHMNKREPTGQQRGAPVPFSAAGWSPCAPTQRVLQWVSRDTLGRTHWETIGLELPLWSVCEDSRDAWSSCLGWWGAGLEPVARICGQCLGGCLLLPSHGRGSQGFLQTSHRGYTYAHAASWGRV